MSATPTYIISFLSFGYCVYHDIDDAISFHRILFIQSELYMYMRFTLSPWNGSHSPQNAKFTNIVILNTFSFIFKQQKSVNKSSFVWPTWIRLANELYGLWKCVLVYVYVMMKPFICPQHNHTSIVFALYINLTPVGTRTPREERLTLYWFDSLLFILFAVSRRPILTDSIVGVSLCSCNVIYSRAKGSWRTVLYTWRYAKSSKCLHQCIYTCTCMHQIVEWICFLQGICYGAISVLYNKIWCRSINWSAINLPSITYLLLLNYFLYIKHFSYEWGPWKIA